MPCVLPFELDTVDAIGSAEPGKEKLIAILSRTLPFAIHAACAGLEFLCEKIVMDKIKEEIVCTKYFEISEAANIFLLTNHFCILSDGMYTVLGPISILMIYNNPFSVFYNGSAGIINMINFVFFLALPGYCAIPESGILILVPYLCFLCGLMHAALAVNAHLSFTRWDKEGEMYFGRITDFIGDMGGK